jgi:ABC-type uncharacterized transport system permease subunit
MSLNPRSIAMFGIGFGAIAIASFGRLAPLDVVPPVVTQAVTAPGAGFTGWQNLNLHTPAQLMPANRARAAREKDEVFLLF